MAIKIHSDKEDKAITYQLDDVPLSAIIFYKNKDYRISCYPRWIGLTLIFAIYQNCIYPFEKAYVFDIFHIQRISIHFVKTTVLVPQLQKIIYNIIDDFEKQAISIVTTRIGL